ncbi:MAG: uroporphyrinogen decarboxylase family protein [Bariatricus sp.]
MKKLIDYLDQFDRRPVYAIYDIPNDFGFGCMDKVSIAVDMGFESEPSGVVMGVVPHPFQSVEEVEAFPWNISLSGSYARAELQNIRTWCANSRIHQGGGSFGPLTVTACILGIEECVRMTHTHPDVLLAVLRHVTDFLLLLAQEEEKEGAQSYWIAEPLASLLSPKLCRKFCTPYITEIFHAIDIPGVLHVCGKTDRHTRVLLETGAQALSIDWCTDLPECIALAPDDVVIMGNINPVLLWDGTPDEIRAQTLLLLEQTRNYKNFVFATGCQVPADAPRCNVQLMVDLARNAPIWSNDEYRTIRRLSALYCEEGEQAFTLACTDRSVTPALADAARDVALKRIAVNTKYPVTK